MEVLSTQPSACLSINADLEPSMRAGQALFNTPTLLGGQGAKAGLSCASCHVNGRDNPHFLLAGVSDKPGTADVTNSFFSVARGNGKFDPVAIPDLAAPGKVSREPGSLALEKFIRELIVEEFSGAEPSYTELESLATYVRAIEPCERNDKAPMPRNLYDQLAIIKGALRVAESLAVRGDRKEEANHLIAAARHQLGLISERYAGAALHGERAELLRASRRLQGIGQLEKSGAMATALAKWIADFQKVEAGLNKKIEQSLYNSRQLAKSLRIPSEAKPAP